MSQTPWELERDEVLDALSNLTALPLSEVDIPGVSEMWNKALAWKDMVMEAFVHRWRILAAKSAADAEADGLCRRKSCPEGIDPLAVRLGSRINDLPDLMYVLIDNAVRELAPARERIARESYRAAQEDTTRQLRTFEDIAQLLDQHGMNPKLFLLAAEAWYFALETHVPYFEEPEQTALEEGPQQSLFSRFFAMHVIQPYFQHGTKTRELLSGVACATVAKDWKLISSTVQEKANFGAKFYGKLFTKFPELLQYFKAVDMDSQTVHLAMAIDTILDSVVSHGDAESKMRFVLDHLGEIHKNLMIPTWTYLMIGSTAMDCFDFQDSAGAGGEVIKASDKIHAFGTLFQMASTIISGPVAVEEALYAKAMEFMDIMAAEFSWSPDTLQTRLIDIKNELAHTGTYELTAEELQHGARVAWRNSAKCPGRISWNTLEVRDCRHVSSAAGVFAEVLEHLKLATAGTNLLSVMSVFRQRAPGEMYGMRFWSSQFVRYACYEGADGKTMGDPANKDFTAWLVRSGLWTPPPEGERTRFDVLPVVLKLEGEERPHVFQLPKEFVHEIKLEHPDCPEFAKLGLRWAAVPVVANFNLKVGGLDYVCCPFNGWFMELEIVRNLVERYQVFDEVCATMKIKTEYASSINRVSCEVATAVVHSFNAQGFTIVDNLACAKGFFIHCQRERQAGRETPGQWSWTGGLCGPNNPLWHHEMRDFYMEPQYQYQSDGWRVQQQQAEDEAKGGGEVGIESLASVEGAGLVKPKVCVAYGSETGTAEAEAFSLARRLRLVKPTLVPLNGLPTSKEELEAFDFLLVLTSTFAKGKAPTNASKLDLEQLAALNISGLKYAVCGLGSSIYPDFCRYAVQLDKALADAGAKRVVALEKADAVLQQTEKVAAWEQRIANMVIPPALMKALTAQREAARMEAGGAEAKPPEVVISWGERGEGGGRGDPLEVTWPVTDLDFVRGAVEAREELRANGGGGPGESTVRVSLRADEAARAEGRELAYETGDHLAIKPLNGRTQVEEFAAAFGVADKLACPVEAEVHDGLEAEALALPAPKGTPLGVMLRRDVSLCVTEGSARRLMDIILHKLKEKGAHSRVAEVERIVEGMAARSKRVDATLRDLLSKYYTLVEFAKGFPEAELTFSEVLPLLSRLTPRYYSISSSALANPNNPSISVGVLLVHEEGGTYIRGVCSNYLAELKEGEQLMLCVRTSTFRLPPSPKLPVILVGPGTGLAPMIGFVEERHKLVQQGKDGAPFLVPPEEGPLGPCTVIFGARTEGTRIYKPQLELWGSGAPGFQAVSSVRPALSREPGVKKQYVQEVLGSMGEELAAALTDEAGGHVYVCGDARMADSCMDALKDAVRKYGKNADGSKMSMVQAALFTSNLKRNHRLQFDVWGIMHDHRESLQHFQAKRTQAASLWLKKMHSHDED